MKNINMNYVKDLDVLGLTLKAVMMAIILIAFTGCYNKQPKQVIIKERETVLILPDKTNYTYIATPELSDTLTSSDKDDAIKILSEYIIRLQTVVMLYEQRVDSLIKWSNEVKQVYDKKDKEKIE